MNIAKGMTVNIEDNDDLGDVAGLQGEVTRTSTALGSGDLAHVRVPKIDADGEPETNEDGELLTRSVMLSTSYLEAVRDGQYLSAILDDCDEVWVRVSELGQYVKATKQGVQEVFEGLSSQPEYDTHIEGDKTRLYIG